MKGFLGSNSASNGSPIPTTSRASTSVDTLIGGQTEVFGDVRFAGGLHVDGKVRGAITAGSEKSGALSVSEGGTVEGNVSVPIIMLNGSIVGDVHCSERLTLAAKAKITGNVHYKVLQMEPGAQINGALSYDDGSEPVAVLTHQLSAPVRTDINFGHGGSGFGGS